MLIPCPHCGPRDADEFNYGGDAAVTRPAGADQLSDEAWTAYLFLRTNPKGWHREYWFHRHGCQRWIEVARDTLTHAIAAVQPSPRDRRDDGSR